VSRVTFIYAAHIGHSTLANHGWRPDPQGAWGATVDVCHVEGGRSRISLSTPLGGSLSMFVALMVGAPGSLSAPPRWARHRCFLTLMVGTPRSSAPTPHRWPVVDVS
jgi:hypothetical protein